LAPPFRPLVRNPHILTIAGNFWRRAIDPQFPATRRHYRIDSSTTIVALEHQPHSGARAQLVLLHGLEGSADSGYMNSLSQAALLRGFGVHRVNSRTCGGTEDLCETMYHSGLTSDTRAILEDIRERHFGPAFVMGFSLGGNVALKLAGELGETDLVAGFCAVSTPIDLATCVRSLEKRSNILYSKRFLRALCNRIRRKRRSAPHLYPTSGLGNVKTVWEFDDLVTAPLFGFGTAANYYATQSSMHYLDGIRVPTLVLCSKDDPLVPFSVYSHPAFDTNPALTLIATEHGGHLGFLARGPSRFWLDQVALDWMESCLGSEISGKGKQKIPFERKEFAIRER